MTGLTVVRSLNLMVAGVDCAPVGPGLLRYNLDSGTLLGAIGVTGAGAVIGDEPQFSAPQQLTAAPWSSTTLLVSDPGNDRVVEVDVVAGVLVKVWLAGLARVSSVAATTAHIAAAFGAMNGTLTAGIRVYSLLGTLLWSRAGTPTSSLVFSPDGSRLIAVEPLSSRVAVWEASTGAYLGPVSSGFHTPVGVVQCVSRAGAGMVVVDSGTSLLTVVTAGGQPVEPSPSPASVAGLLQPSVLVLVPGLGGVAASRSTSLIAVLSSVAITTHPANATAAVGSPVTFFVILSPTSARAGVTFSWTQGGLAVGYNASTYTYVPSNADVTAGATFAVMCTVTHALGRAVSAPAILTVVGDVTVLPRAVTVSAGSDTAFEASLLPGVSALSFEWRVGGATVGHNSSVLVFAPGDDIGGRTLQVLCRVTTSNGSVVLSNPSMLTVQVRRRESFHDFSRTVWDPLLRCGMLCICPQCFGGRYLRRDGGCARCPAYTTSIVTNAESCLPQCPALSTLTVRCVQCAHLLRLNLS